jgi:hypothetical protein
MLSAAVPVGLLAISRLVGVGICESMTILRQLLDAYVNFVKKNAPNPELICTYANRNMKMRDLERFSTDTNASANSRHKIQMSKPITPLLASAYAEGSATAT